MVEQIVEFVGNHPFLVGTFGILLIAFFVHEARQGGAAISTGGLVNLVNREDGIILDVRDKKEFGQGHIVDAVNVPLVSIDQRASELEDKKNKPIIIVCKMGQHAGAAGKKLKALGFADVRRLRGGMAEWTAASLPIIKG